LKKLVFVVSIHLPTFQVNCLPSLLDAMVRVRAAEELSCEDDAYLLQVSGRGVEPN
jgi:hypothetical protein